MFIRRLHSDYRHGTWPMFSKNYKILKFYYSELPKFTSVEKHLSPKTLIGPGKLRIPGLSRNGPQGREEERPWERGWHTGLNSAFRVTFPVLLGREY